MPQSTHYLGLMLMLLAACVAAGQPQGGLPATNPSTVTIRVFDIRADRRYSSQQPMLSVDGKVVGLGAADVAGQSSTITVYNAREGRALFEATGPLGGGFWLAALSPESSKAAIVRMKPRVKGEVDGSLVEVIDLASRTILHTFDAAPALASGSVLFTPDGERVGFPVKRPRPDPDYDKTVYSMIDLKPGQPAVSYKFPRFDGVRLISDDGARVLSWRGAVLDAKSGVMLSQLEWPNDYTPVAMRVLHDGTRIRALDPDYSVRTWDGQTGKLLDHVAGPMARSQGTPAEFNGAGDRFFLNGSRAIVAFDATTATPLGEWSHGIPGGNITDMAPRGGALVVTSNEPDRVRILTMPFPGSAEFKTIQPTTRETQRPQRGSAGPRGGSPAAGRPGDIRPRSP